MLNIVLLEQREADTHAKLEASLQACRQTMHAAATMYNINRTVSEAICMVFVRRE
jgi:hypothetical protein